MALFRALERIGDAAGRAPHAVRLLTELERAVQHRDLGARYYLAREGWRDGLEFVNPQMRLAVDVAIPKFKDAWSTFRDALDGNLIEAEASDVAEPWADFITHYRALPWGVVCVYGDPGQGKTEFMKKSAAIWRERWPRQSVEAVGFYEDDRPLWMRQIRMRRLIDRMTKVSRFIDQEEEGVDYDDGLTEEDLRGKTKATVTAPRRIEASEIDRMGYRTVLVDEAGLYFSSFGNAGEQKTRDAAKRFSDQIRHLKSRFVFSAQKVSDVPPHVRSSAINVYKLASMDVIRQDYKLGQGKRDNAERWFEAITAIQAVITGGYPEPLPNVLSEDAREAIRLAARAHVYYEDEWADPRAWGYVVASRLGGHGIRTVFPFTPVEPMPALGPKVDILDEFGEVIERDDE